MRDKRNDADQGMLTQFIEDLTRLAEQVFQNHLSKCLFALKYNIKDSIDFRLERYQHHFLS